MERVTRFGLAACAAAVALADVLQVLLLDWRPKHWGALAGAALYAVVAIGALRGARWPCVVALVVPVLPLSVVAAWQAGLELPVPPDREMLGILVFQLAAAGFGAARLRAAPVRADRGP